MNPLFVTTVAPRAVQCGDSRLAFAAHIHSAVITFVDKDHYKAQWTTYENGEPGYVASFEMVRVAEPYD